MSSIKINMLKSEVLPEGTYPVVVERVVVKTSQRDTKYLEFMLGVDDGGGGRTILMQRSLEKAIGMLVRDLKALGIATDGDLEIEWEDDDSNIGSSKRPDWAAPLLSPDLEGRTALAVVHHTEWEGETREKVRRLLPVEDDE